MPQPKTLDFNRLPRASRQRLVDAIAGRVTPSAILFDKLTVRLAAIGWGFLAVCAAGGLLLIAAERFGSYYFRSRQGPGHLAAYAGLVLVAAFSTLSVIRRVHLTRQLPFAPGRYLFPLDFVDARGRQLRLASAGSLVDFSGVHHHTNGVYTHTELRFKFEGGGSQMFTVRGKEAAEAKLAELQSVRQRIREAVEANDMETLAELDVFIDARLGEKWDSGADAREGDGPVAGELPIVSRSRFVLGLAAAAVIGAPAWLVRNRLSDDAAFAKVRRIDRAETYREYLSTGGRHVPEVQETLLPRAALAEAKKAHSARLLRAVVRDFPRSPVVADARAALHELFVKAHADFRRHASTTDPRVPRFIDALLDYEEAHDSPPLRVRFQRPTGDLLAKTDELLAKLAKDKTIAPIAPHFKESAASPREQAIVTALAHAFKSVVPGDVLPLEGDGAADRRRLAPTTLAGDRSGPSIDIRYEVAWSGAIYQGEKSARSFVGIRVPFDVEMKIPGNPETLRFSLDVRPPERFEVNWTTYGSRLGAAAGAPPDEQVYAVMALRAYDALDAELKRVLFRADFVPKKPTLRAGATARDDSDSDSDDGDSATD